MGSAPSSRSDEAGGSRALEDRSCAGRSQPVRIRRPRRGATASAVWSPDGRQVVIAAPSLQCSPHDPCRSRTPTGGTPGKAVLTGQGIAHACGWSPDGQVVAFFTQTEATNSFDIGILPIAGDRKPWFLVASTADENGGNLSPDGRWLSVLLQRVRAIGRTTSFPIRARAGNGKSPPAETAGPSASGTEMVSSSSFRRTGRCSPSI